jgi:lipopolysaccharide export system protein LptC
MNATLSTRQLRLVVLLLLVVVVAGGYMVVSKNKTTTQPSTAHTTPAVTTPAHTTPTPSKAHAHAVSPVKADTHGLPAKVVLALHQHSVVVVSLSSPGAQVDQMAAAEAKAGADEMHAGFVNVDVRHQRPGMAILHKLGIVDTPAVLVVKRPGAVYSDFKGFVDRDVVAQAVTDAR